MLFLEHIQSLPRGRMVRPPCQLTFPASQASDWPFHLRCNSSPWWYSLTSFCMTGWVVNDILGSCRINSPLIAKYVFLKLDEDLGVTPRLRQFLPDFSVLTSRPSRSLTTALRRPPRLVQGGLSPSKFLVILHKDSDIFILRRSLPIVQLVQSLATVLSLHIFCY